VEPKLKFQAIEVGFNICKQVTSSSPDLEDLK